MKTVSVKCLAMLIVTVAFAHSNMAISAEIVFTSKIQSVYPLADGNFVLTFNPDSTSCSGTGSPRYHNVTVGQNSINADGSKKIYAAAMLAMAMNKLVWVVFDNATANCYINRIIVIN
jgi:hypothetical protein